MKNLFEYDFLVNEVFYKCQPILKWIEANPNMSDLDREAIQATIMDALVYKGLIDSEKVSLDLTKLCIVDNLEHYVYKKHPNICGIPQWMKEEFRKKSLYITGGQPVSIFLAKPPSKITRYCVYDPNTAVSSIFSDATFYNALYDSPTRKGVRLDEVRPFVEVDIDGELYLVDTLTKRILKSSWFKSTYNFEVKSSKTISKMDKKSKEYYNESVSENISIATTLSLTLPLIEQNNSIGLSEMKYEIEKSKEYYPEEWEKYENLKIEMEQFMQRRKCIEDWL